MKKMVALVLAGTMMAGMASVASAKNFDTPVWCNSTTNYTMADSEGDQKLNDTHAAIYVRHYDNVDTTEFRITTFKKDGDIRYQLVEILTTIITMELKEFG